MSFDKKWELLKPHIKRLYIDEDRPLSEVIGTMKREFDFNAIESSYKYYINKKWKMKKSIPASKKSAMCDILQTRANAGKPSVITYKGKQVDLNKLRRFKKEDARQQAKMRAASTSIEGEATITSHTIFTADNRIFLNWNMPYGGMRRTRGMASGGPSPAETAASTPSDVVVTTPSSTDAPSPHSVPSPMSVVLRQKAAMDRANLFLEGRHHELLGSMNSVERRVILTWLYQFWLFSFQTAKNWGYGPRNWTADLLRFEDYHDIISSPRNISSPTNARTFPSPSPLCRWAIHASSVRYEPLPDAPAEALCNPYDEATWRAWTRTPYAPSFEETLSNGLESNDFSTLRAADLPVAVPQIAEAARRSPSELLVEALGFSIMGRNVDLATELGRKLFTLHKTDFRNFYPFHLATSYLDGSRICCNLLDILVSLMPPSVSLRQTYTNHLGHTILDNLMISILKSHTSCLPGKVDDVWQRENHFPGEEVDICGRWDADSDCIRSLPAHDEAAIPFEWKHKFCHTSAQTICHCINTIFFASYAPDINTPSGIFVKRCLNCGLKLQLTPLHTLVLTASALSQHGAVGEDLFGIIACALCLLWHGANASVSAQISLDALWGIEQAEQCSHEELSVIQLADRLASQFQDWWTNEVRTGWQIFRFILCSSHRQWNTTKSADGNEGDDRSQNNDTIEIYDDSEKESDSFSIDYCCDAGKGVCYFGKNKELGILYAAVQTELATYRRLAEGDLWTSRNFDMEELLWSLMYEEEPRIGLIEKGLMKPFCRCGLFDGDWSHCLRADEACVSYFMNMDVWPRATFIDIPPRNHD